MLSTRDYGEGRYLVFATRAGIVKKTEFAAYNTPINADGIIAVLTDAGPGVTVRGVHIASEIGEDCDHTAGTFRRATKALRDDGPLGQ